ncbi:MAG: queuosine precursor transporter [Halanaerobium sp.]|nr:queuosine precursor transporter [Halanaerobium sp.]
MSNEILFILMTIIGLGMTLLAYLLGGKAWLKAIIGVNIILANIYVTKQINLFGIAATGGNILYGSIFLATDLLSEHYGKDEANDGVRMGFYFALVFVITSQFIIRFAPNAYDTVQNSMLTLFTFLPRILLASLIAYLLSQFTDIYLYHRIKDLLPARKYLWLRNNVSTWVSQLIDSVTFTLIAFLGEFPPGILLQIIFTTYLLKIVVAMMDTIFIYLSYYLKREKGKR